MHAVTTAHLRFLCWLSMPCALAFTAATATAAPQGAVPDTLAQRLLACAPCHGREGKASASGYQPRLAGKPAGYLYNQLLNFRHGRRNNEAMTALIDPLSEPYLREIAAHYAAQDLPYPPPQTPTLPPEQAALGRQLVERGDTQRGIPACSSCHGSTLTGVQPTVPGLLGLPRDYISGQLGAWQTGLRRAPAPDCMAQVARRLQPADVHALAGWLSAQPVPAPSHPAPAWTAAQTAKLPLDCSGLQR